MVDCIDFFSIFRPPGRVLMVDFIQFVSNFRLFDQEKGPNGHIESLGGSQFFSGGASGNTFNLLNTL